jgi:pimeloyl-ACP methyl ester carboxylesterase
MNPQNLFININSRKLAYTQWGDANNEKVLFCVHGLSRNGRDFDFLAQALADNYRVICVDIAGRGRSDWFEKQSQYNYPTYVSDIFVLLDNLGIKKVDWVGTSMGGIIAMLVAAMRPGLINKLVINDIGPFFPGAAIGRIVEYVRNAPLFDSFDAAAAAMRARMSTFGINKEEHWQHIFQYSIQQVGDKFRFAYDPKIVKKSFSIKQVLKNLLHPSKWREMPDVDLWKFWDAVNCPVLLLRGEVSDILSRETAEKMLQKPNVKMVEFKGVGHAPMLMDEEQIGVVVKWLINA